MKKNELLYLQLSIWLKINRLFTTCFVINAHGQLFAAETSVKNAQSWGIK